MESSLGASSLAQNYFAASSFVNHYFVVSFFTCENFSRFYSNISCFIALFIFGKMYRKKAAEQTTEKI